MKDMLERSLKEIIERERRERLAREKAAKERARQREMDLAMAQSKQANGGA